MSVTESNESEPKAKKPKAKKAKASAKKKAPAKAKKTTKAKTAKVNKPKREKPNGIVGELHMHAEGPRADMITMMGKSLGKLHTADKLAEYFEGNKARVSHVMAMVGKKAARYKAPYKVVKEEGKYGLSAK